MQPQPDAGPRCTLEFHELVITSAWNLGIRNFDINQAWDACSEDETCVPDRPVGDR